MGEKRHNDIYNIALQVYQTYYGKTPDLCNVLNKADSKEFNAIYQDVEYMFDNLDRRNGN